MEATIATAVAASLPPSSNELARITQAARDVLNNGWYLIACVPNTKQPFPGSHWKEDARNDESAMQTWNNGEAANPAIYLQKSCLTVLDIDCGLCDLDHALRFAKQIGLPKTMMVRTGGRDSYRVQFYFVGSREFPEAQYSLEGISGQIKHNGYVMAAGAVHPLSGELYEIVNPGVPPAPLPDSIRDYTTEKEPRATKTTKQTVSTPVAIPTQPEYTDRKIWVKFRHDFLLREACYLRKRGIEVDAVFAAIKDICINRCEGGVAYARNKEDKLRGIAEYACRLPIARIRMPRSPKPVPELWAKLTELCPMSTPVSIHQLKLDNPSLVDIPTTTLRYARKALGISTYNDKGVWMWLRQGKPEDKTIGHPEDTSSLDLTSYPNVHTEGLPSLEVSSASVDILGLLGTHLTPIAVDSIPCGHVDIVVTTSIPKEQPKGKRSPTYWREQKRKQRAAKQVSVIPQEVANDFIN